MHSIAHQAAESLHVLVEFFAVLFGPPGAACFAGIHFEATGIEIVADFMAPKKAMAAIVICIVEAVVDPWRQEEVS